MKMIMSVLVLVGMFLSSPSWATFFSPALAPTLTSSSAKILDPNGKRTYLLIINSGSVAVYIDIALQSGNTGVVIPAGGVYEPINAPTNVLYGKTASSTAALVVIQGQ